jgi:hypothetical protein
MKPYSDMTIWELQQERAKIDYELSSRFMHPHLCVTGASNPMCTCGAHRHGEITVMSV